MENKINAAYAKVINSIINGENKEFENSFIEPHTKKLMILALKAVQELAEAEVKKEQEPKEEVIVDRFYSDLPKDEAVALMYEILDNADVIMASKLTRMFVNNRITVDRIKHLIEYYKNEHKTVENRAE